MFSLCFPVLLWVINAVPCWRIVWPLCFKWLSMYSISVQVLLLCQYSIVFNNTFNLDMKAQDFLGLQLVCVKISICLRAEAFTTHNYFWWDIFNYVKQIFSGPFNSFWFHFISWNLTDMYRCNIKGISTVGFMWYSPTTPTTLTGNVIAEHFPRHVTQTWPCFLDTCKCWVGCIIY